MLTLAAQKLHGQVAGCYTAILTNVGATQSSSVQKIMDIIQNK